MNPVIRNILLWFSILFFTGILLGALGAHSFEKLLSPEQMESFETGVRYQFYAALSLLGLAALYAQIPFSLTWPVRLIIWGCVLFSGSIYLLVFQEIWHVNLAKFLWPITPIGGLLMMISPAIICLNVFKAKTKHD